MTRQLTTQDRVMLLLSLVPFLIEHGPTTIEEISRSFDVPAAELRNLVRFLGVAGVPGETNTYQDEDLFDIDWDALENDDVVNLTRTIAVDDTPRFSAAEAAALVAALHSLKPVFPDDLGSVAARAIEKLTSIEVVDSTRATVSIEADARDPRLAQLAAAIAQAQHLSFEYRDAFGRATSRTVEPQSLVQSGTSWYLRAFCLERQAERMFLVDRLREVRTVSSSRESSVDSSMRLVSKSATTSPFAMENTTVTAKVLIRQGVLSRLFDFAPRLVSEEHQDWVRVEVDLLHPMVAIRLVQAAPGDVIIEAPAEAREAVRQWAGRALAQYDL